MLSNYSHDKAEITFGITLIIQHNEVQNKDLCDEFLPDPTESQETSEYSAVLY